MENKNSKKAKRDRFSPFSNSTWKKLQAAKSAQLRQHFAFPELYFARVVSFWMVNFTWGPLLRGNNAGLKSLFWREGNRQKRLPASSGITKQWQQLWKHHTETMTWLVEGARGKIVIRSTRAARTCRFRLTLQNGKLKQERSQVFARAFFMLVHFIAVLVLSKTWSDLLCGRQILHFFFSATSEALIQI